MLTSLVGLHIEVLSAHRNPLFILPKKSLVYDAIKPLKSIFQHIPTYSHNIYPSSEMSSDSNVLVKLSEESLTREPEEVFDLLKKIGEG